MKTKLPDISKLILEAKGNSVIARAAGIDKKTKKANLTPQAVSKWKADGKVPVDRVPLMAKLTGRHPSEIRPDVPHIFPPPKKTAAKKKLKEVA
jgi:hypothetical protein